MIDTFLPQGTTKPIKCIEYLIKHRPSTKKQIFVADTSSGRVQGELWRIAMTFFLEVKELQAWKAEVERICRTMNGPNRDTALFIMTNEVEEE